MHCPRCGCHAGHDISRFCRNCGFRLDGVAQLLARNGAPEGFALPAPVAAKTPSPRKKGIKKGGKILFASVAFFPLFFGLCFLVDSPGPLVIPAFTFFAGLMRMLYARLFEDELPELPAMIPSPPMVAAPPPASFLPGPYQPPYVRDAPTTGELSQPAGVKQPPSVVEPTTNLLNRS